jgi:4-hydroxybenzoate polyprenyltransferase/phosphoserine phosphatase
MSQEESRSEPARPLVVDVDGTLIKSDLTFERLRKFLMTPSSYKLLFANPPSDKLSLKLALEETQEVNLSSLPVNEEVLALIKVRHSEGGEIHLVSGSPQKSVEELSRRFPHIASATGSKDGVNLIGTQKLEFLRQRFPDGFDYIGDSKADVKIWQEAASAYTVTRKFKRHAGLLGSTKALANWFRLMRPKHWVKNTLVFLPALLEIGRSGSQLGSNWLIDTFVAFAVLSMAASATYILNDIIDLDHDRSHETKRNRPIAAGDVSLPKTVVMFMLLSVGSVLIALGALGGWIAFCLILYQILGILYSTVLKIKFVDVLVLAFLFDLRLVVGMFAASAAYSFWLLIFAFFGFLSLGYLKRFSELSHVQNSGDTRKGYEAPDKVAVMVLGMGAALVAVNTFATFLDARGLTQQPLSALLIPLLLIFFLTVWSLASRSGDLQDPVVYVLQNPMLVANLAVFAMLYWYVSKGVGQ